jgi:hypothetical protein
MSPMPGPASALGARRAVATSAPASGLTNRPARATAPRSLPGPMAPVRNPAAERSARRRREVVTVLFAATTLSAAVASAIGGTAVWGLQILTDLALLTFVVSMLWFRGNGATRARNVHYLPQVRPRPVPAYALRRTASS